MQIEKIKISQLKNWDKNPRGISVKDFETLKKRLSAKQQFKPLLVNQDNIVLGGNMRLRAMMELGWSEADVVRVETKDEKEMTWYALVDNEKSGYYEDEKLAELAIDMPELEDIKVDLGKSVQLGDLMDKFRPVEEDEVPEVEEGEPISKLGEVYQLGRHRLMCGDATKREDVEKLMGGKKADMVFTDPPYKAEMQGAGLAIDKDSVDGWSDYGSGSDFDLLDVGSDFNNILFGLSDNLLFLVTYNQVYDLLAEAVGRKMKNRLLPVCKTTAPFPSSSNWMIDMNWGVHIYKNPRGRRNNRSWHVIDKATDVEAKKDVGHPSPYRMDLLVEFVSIASESEDVVLDPFGGSGSTLIACEQTNRTCYMMEIDPHYCDVIRKRFENYVKK